MDHRRSVLASLVKGGYILERDRQQRRHESQALAPFWWESFDFKLKDKLIDHDGKSIWHKDSIFGAIYEYEYPSPDSPRDPNIPQYVIAFRGTIMEPDTVLRDNNLNLQCFFNKLHKTRCFKVAMDYVQKMVDEGARVWLAGHSLGSAMALLAGKNMAKTGCFLETYLFNPPFYSVPIDGAIKSEDLKFVYRCSKSVLKVALAGISRAVNGAESHEPFVELSSWVPNLFVNPNDPICFEYIGYFAHRKKMEESGLGLIERIATKKSIKSLCSSVVAKASRLEPLHLPHSAYLIINMSPFLDDDKGQNFRTYHELQQWWKCFACESTLCKY